LLKRVGSDPCTFLELPLAAACRLEEQLL